MDKKITLVPMTEEQFQAYREWAVPDYAQDNVRSGSWSEAEALEKSEKQFRELLPEGLHTPDHYLFSILDRDLGRNVGILWFNLVRDTPGKPAFLYHIVIEEPDRRQGYGLLALQALEDRVASMGGSAVRLHVFGHNSPARELYQKAGYQVTNVVMAKALDHGEGG